MIIVRSRSLHQIYNCLQLKKGVNEWHFECQVMLCHSYNPTHPPLPTLTSNSFITNASVVELIFILKGVWKNYLGSKGKTSKRIKRTGLRFSRTSLCLLLSSYSVIPCIMNVKPQLESSIMTCLWKLVWPIIKHLYEHVCLLINTYNIVLPKQDSGTKQNLVALCRNYGLLGTFAGYYFA